jgi:hypothetical protein
VRPEGAYDFAGDGAGTRVTFSLRADPKGPAKLMSPMIAKSMRSEVEALDELRRVLEQG